MSNINTPHKLIGGDFGVPRRAGDQAKKNIVIEAIQRGDRRYAIEPAGRNERLVRDLDGKGDWRSGRRGWTVPELAQSLASDEAITAVALDFPFSIPLSLLCDTEFASRLDEQPFNSRRAWAAYVKNNLRLQFTNDGPRGELEDLKRFEVWRDKQFWRSRYTDRATLGSPPLKHIYQNVFAMTLAGTSFLSSLEDSGYYVVLDSARPQGARNVFETYPRAVAKRIGFMGSYKHDSGACLDQAVRFLAAHDIQLKFDPRVRLFCETYRTGPKKDDPDGADAFLCLIASICFHEHLAELVVGDASSADLSQEGAIIVPIAAPDRSMLFQHAAG